MIYCKLLSIISLATVFFCLVIKGTESLPLKLSNNEIRCPTSIKKYHGKPKQFVIILKSDNSNNGEKVLDKHLKFMAKCWKNRILTLLPANVNSVLPNSDNDQFTSFVSDQLTGYSAPYDPEFVKDNLVELSEIEIIELVLPVKASNLVQTNPNPNLDRIDQRKLPLDKKFSFPNSQGSGVNVYIVDTGINIKHQEFAGRARHGGSFCPNCPATDDHGHGTHVAALVGGKTFGVARQSTLIAVKVLNSSGSGSTSGVLDGLSFILNKHKASSNKKTVVNMSLGGPVSQALNAGVESLIKAGIHVITSAGNGNKDACSQSPASVPSAITVGATDISDKVASFSNFGNCVDIFAPGVNIISASSKSNTGSAVFSGTSQAAPHVAGVVALSIIKSGNATPAVMAKRIIDSSTKGVLKLATSQKSNTQNRLLFIS